VDKRDKKRRFENEKKDKKTNRISQIMQEREMEEQKGLKREIYVWYKDT